MGVLEGYYKGYSKDDGTASCRDSYRGFPKRFRVEG